MSTERAARTVLGAAIVASAVALLVPGSVGARADGEVVRTVFPSAEDPGPPLYARVGDPAGPQVYHDGEWAAIVFYRDLDCVPDDFDLLQFFAFQSLGCQLTVSGFSIWEVEIFSAPPKVVEASGSAVPIWFVPVDVIEGAVADGVLTLGELRGLEGAVLGHADRFQEVLHPIPLPPELGGGGHPDPKLVQRARGSLEDGRRFLLRITHIYPEAPRVEIALG